MKAVDIKPKAAEALQGYKGVIRLQVRTSGCCEPALIAFWDKQHPGDLYMRLGELLFVVDPESHGITGLITVDIHESGDPPTLLLTTANPLSEWAGLAGTVIRERPD